MWTILRLHCVKIDIVVGTYVIVHLCMWFMPCLLFKQELMSLSGKATREHVPALPSTFFLYNVWHVLIFCGLLPTSPLNVLGISQI